jgi:hypothetical protein
MLRLVCLRGTVIELPYHPEMQVWQYLRDIIAPTAHFELVDGKTVLERVLAKGQAFNFKNKHRRLDEMIEDGGSLCYQLPLGPSWGTIQGNACPDGGDAEGCPVCLEDHFDFSLDCLHRFHAKCLLSANTTLCPTCRTPFTVRDREHLYCMQRLLTATKRQHMGKRP